MDDATQKLVDEARRAIENHDPAEPCPAVDVIPRLADALEAAYSQKVEPEPEPEYKLPGYDEVLEKLDALTIRKDN